MAESLNWVIDRLKQDWLIGLNSQILAGLLSDRLQSLKTFTQKGLFPKILLLESDPIEFLAGFFAAAIEQCPIFLGNPNWVEAEQHQAFQLIQPDLIWGTTSLLPVPPLSKGGLGGVFPFSKVGEASPLSKVGAISPQSQQGWIMIPTGGSSGQIRFAIHTWKTLTASVYGFQHYFQVDRVNSCCTLPLYHVSGLMQVMRSLLTGGKLAIVPFKSLEAGFLPLFEPSTFFLSLVPTQLQRSLQNSKLTNWLARLQTVLLGGAPAWAALLETAREKKIRLALTYGMTETASQVIALKPDDFLAGNNSSGQVLPHATVTIATEGGMSDPIGRITIQAKSLAIGYYPDPFLSPHFQPDDLGYFDAQGYLHLVGRDSHKIITGGENVFPAEVEAAIRASGLVADVCVIGMPDRTWGEVVTAVYVPDHPTVSIDQIQLALDNKLAKFKRPKQWIAIDSLPRNAQGKVNYDAVKRSILQKKDL